MHTTVTFSNLLRSLKVDSGADSLHNVSVRNYIEELCDGNYNHQLRVPYIEIIKKHLMAHGLEPHIRTVCSVKKIRFVDAADPRMEVQLENDEILQADHVIVTVSLGVLKRSLDSMFEPPLPAFKRQTVKSMGYGSIGKVILVYDQPFWKGLKSEHVKGDVRSLRLLWNDNCLAQASDLEKRYVRAKGEEMMGGGKEGSQCLW